MRVNILYFAVVGDLVERGEESLDLPVGVTTVGHLADMLVTRYPALDGRLGHVRFARNLTFASLDEEITNGDEIALIPPVAGG
jgi:molybdopterin converting factor subunit 1